MTVETALTIQGAAAVPAEQVNELATRLVNNKGLFDDTMTPLQAKQIAMIAVAYELDPWMGEVVLYEGKPLITYDGRIRVVATDPAYDGVEPPRPATEDERKAFRVRDSEDMWVVTAWRKGVRFPSVGYGRAGGAYERNALVIGSKRTGYNPERGPEMAIKRAKVNALRGLFPMPRPKFGGTENVPFTIETSPEEHRGPLIEGASRELPADDAPPGPTKEQLAAIHIAAEKLFGVAHYDPFNHSYTNRLSEMFGVTSATQLTQGQAQAVIDTFTAELAEREARAPIDAGVAEARQRAQERGSKARDALVLPDDDHGAARVTSASDPLWTRWLALCAAATVLGDIVIQELELPVAQQTISRDIGRLEAIIAIRKDQGARDELRAAAHEMEMTDLQLNGLLEHHYGVGVNLASCSAAQADAILALLGNGEVPDAMQAPMPEMS